MQQAVRARRTQAERTATTRAKLLDAALECLVERGYAGTTTTEVADRAGVSRGAQLHHFPTRAALVAAAVEHLYARMTADYQAGFASLSPRADRLRAGVDLLWSMFTRRHFAAVGELFTAARTDAELRAHLAPIAAHHEANVFRLARGYFPDLARHDARFDTALALILDAMNGMAATRGLGLPGPSESTRLDTLYTIAAQAFGEPAT
ncbi:MAG: helix-turn-helix domain-containing protein [Deltaproteobacteria bacterium]|nr:helix-turn-helix domain-containing protein [Deltaproteobacteria bacterium]